MMMKKTMAAVSVVMLNLFSTQINTLQAGKEAMPDLKQGAFGLIQTYVKRLEKGADLKKAIETIVHQEGIKGGTVISAVGSLSEASLRYAGAKVGPKLAGPFEITSLIGTISPDGVHLHISLADSEGFMRGGHLMDGCITHTTVELVLGIEMERAFSRSLDQITGYKELSWKFL